MPPKLVIFLKNLCKVVVVVWRTWVTCPHQMWLNYIRSKLLWVLNAAQSNQKRWPVHVSSEGQTDWFILISWSWQGFLIIAGSSHPLALVKGLVTPNVLLPLNIYYPWQTSRLYLYPLQLVVRFQDLGVYPVEEWQIYPTLIGAHMSQCMSSSLQS